MGSLIARVSGMTILAFVYTLLFYKFCHNQIQQSQLYYQAPKWNINDPSITIGTVQTFVRNDSRIDLTYSAGATLTAFCQINMINKGLTGPKIKGNLNFKVYQSSNFNETIQYFTVKLLENSLYNLTTKQPLIAGNDSEKLGVVFLSSAIGNARAGYGVTDFYGIPFLDYGTQGRNGFQNTPLPTEQFGNTVLYSLRLTQNFTIASAVFELLNYYNWTLVASFYERSEFGSYMLSIVQSQPANSSTIFVCNEQASVSRPSAIDGRSVSDFCSCVERYDSIGVIILWGQLQFSNRIAAIMKSQCSGFNNRMFLVADDSDLLFPQPAIDFSLQNSLWINSDSPSEYSEFLKNCSEALSSETEQFLYQKFVDDLLVLRKACTIYGPIVDGVSTCPSQDVAEELRNDTVASEFFFVADAISTVAEAVYLLQNNCSYLNEKLSLLKESEPEATIEFLEAAGIDLNSDFCAIKNFTPFTLAVVMRFVNFTGYTGLVTFDYETLFRRKKNYYVFNFGESIFDIQRVGLIAPGVFELNATDIVFPNNNATPISAIVPDNPSLDDAIVAVFFGVFILFEVAFLGILAAYIYLRNEPRIRKNSPNLSYILYLGCITLTASIIISCVDTSDAICIVSMYMGYTGISLIFGALVAKHYRVYRIFCNSSATAVVIQEWKLYLLIFLLWLYFMFVDSMLLVAGYGAYTTVSGSNPFYIYVACQCDSAFWNTFFKIVLTLSKVFVVVLAAILAFLTRKVPSSYSESNQIAIISYTIIAFGIVLAPLYFIMGSNTDSQTFKFIIQSVLVTIALASVLFILCLPILYQVYRDRRLRNERGD